MMNNNANKIVLILQTVPLVPSFSVKCHFQDTGHSPVKLPLPDASLAMSGSLYVSLDLPNRIYLLPTPSQEQQVQVGFHSLFSEVIILDIL